MAADFDAGVVAGVVAAAVADVGEWMKKLANE